MSQSSLCKIKECLINSDRPLKVLDIHEATGVSRKDISCLIHSKTLIEYPGFTRIGTSGAGNKKRYGFAYFIDKNSDPSDRGYSKRGTSWDTKLSAIPDTRFSASPEFKRWMTYGLLDSLSGL